MELTLTLNIMLIKKQVVFALVLLKGRTDKSECMKFTSVNIFEND